MVRLFDVNNGALVPTEHCYALTSLQMVMKEYPENYLKIYMYLFYMCAPDPHNNPFFDLPEEEKEDIILKEIMADFSPEDETIQIAMKRCIQLYETPTLRAYNGIKKALDNMAKYMQNTPITDGRDGNISQIRAVAKDFDAIRQSFKGTMKDLLEEQKGSVRGGQQLAYDQ